MKKQNKNSAKVDAFLAEIKAVCEKHGLCISHEDGHGAFEIEEYNDHDMEWFIDAYDKTKGGVW